MKTILCILISSLCFGSALGQEQWQKDYARARRLAARSELGEAWLALEQAYKLGLRDVEMVLLEPAFASLRNDAMFRNAIRSYSVAEPLSMVREDEAGERLILRGVIYDGDGTPAKGAMIYAFHADADGEYTESDPMDEPNARIFGYVRANDHGKIELRTIRPGAYPERTDVEGAARYIPRHVHVRVTSWKGAVTDVQVVFEDDPRLSHPYWQEWARKGGHPIAKVNRQKDGSVVALFELKVGG